MYGANTERKRNRTCKFSLWLFRNHLDQHYRHGKSLYKVQINGVFFPLAIEPYADLGQHDFC